MNGMPSGQTLASRRERYLLAVMAVFSVVMFVLIHDIEVAGSEHHGAADAVATQTHDSPHVEGLCALLIVGASVFAIRVGPRKMRTRIFGTSAPRVAWEAGSWSDKPPCPDLDGFRPMLA